jgi:Outer membrane protein beta-barrel domain
MKRCQVLIFALFSVNSVCGQAKLSLHAGMGHHSSNQIGKVLFYENPPIYSPRLGVAVGANINVPLHKRSMYQVGLFYQGKATDYNIPQSLSFAVDGTLQFHYLSINQNFLYRVLGTKKQGLYAGAGLFGSVALSGTFEEDVLTFSGRIHSTGSINFKNGNDVRFRRFDAGGNLLVMGQYKKWQATLQLSHSFAAYIKPEKIRFTSLFLMLGYEL